MEARTAIAALGGDSRGVDTLILALLIAVGIELSAHATQAVGYHRLLLIAVAVEHIVVVDDILVSEVEHQGRVEGHPTETRFEVEV